MKKHKTIRIFVDGSGSNGSGKGSGFAYLVEGQPTGCVERQDALTNNQAEYFGVVSALKAVPPKSSIEILSDSQLAVYQLAGKYKICDPVLRDLAATIQALIKKRRLTVRFTWIPRGQNKADKLLSKK